MASRVAVIIPTYNRLELLQEALASVLSQSRLPDEIVVVDDGSTDDTWSMLQMYGSPVIAIHQENRGRSVARNVGIEASTADLICFLDSDDLLTPKSIEVRAQWLEDHPECVAVYGKTLCVDLLGNTVSRREDPLSWPPDNLFARLARHNSMNIHISTIMMRRDYLPAPSPFPEGISGPEDWHMLLRMTSAGHRFDWLPETISLYRQHEGMTLPQGAPLSRDDIYVQNSVYDLDAFHQLQNRVKGRIVGSHALSRMRTGYRQEARSSLRQSFRTAPAYLPAYALWLMLLLPDKVNALIGRTFQRFSRTLHRS